MCGVLLTFDSCKKADTTPPVITLVGSSPMTVTLGSTFTDPGVTATDDVDGVVTSKVVVTGTVNTAAAGTYTLNYNVSDAAGNAATQVTRTVYVAVTVAYLAGKAYQVSDAVTGGSTATYGDNITASSTTPGRFLVSKFGDYTGGLVNMDISGNTGQTVTLAQQTVNCGNPAADRAFSGSGTISADGKTITVNYTETTNGTTDTAVETYVAQ